MENLKLRLTVLLILLLNLATAQDDSLYLDSLYIDSVNIEFDSVGIDLYEIHQTQQRMMDKLDLLEQYFIKPE